MALGWALQGDGRRHRHGRRLIVAFASSQPCRGSQPAFKKCSSIKKMDASRAVHLQHRSEGGSDRDALVRGTLYAPNLDAVKRYVPMVNPTTVRGRTDLAVILSDSTGKEVWRGPANGHVSRTVARVAIPYADCGR